MGRIRRRDSILSGFLASRLNRSPYENEYHFPTSVCATAGHRRGGRHRQARTLFRERAGRSNPRKLSGNGGRGAAELERKSLWAFTESAQSNERRLQPGVALSR